MGYFIESADGVYGIGIGIKDLTGGLRFVAKCGVYGGEYKEIWNG